MGQHTALLINSGKCGWTDLRLALEAMPEVCVVGEATSVDQARQLASSYTPDIIICSARVDGASVLPLLRDLRESVCTTSRIIALAAHLDRAELTAFSALGAAGYLLWGELSIEGLRRCLAAVVGGDVVVISRGAATGLAVAQTTPTDPRQAVALNEREQAVLQRLAQGLTYRQVARVEPLSQRTVERIVATLEAKLDAPCQFILGMKAAESGLLR